MLSSILQDSGFWLVDSNVRCSVSRYFDYCVFPKRFSKGSVSDSDSNDKFHGIMVQGGLVQGIPGFGSRGS